MLRPLRANSRFLSWVGKTERCYTRNGEESKEKACSWAQSCGRTRLHVLATAERGKGVRARKRESSTGETGKATAALEAGYVPPIAPHLSAAVGAITEQLRLEVTSGGHHYCSGGNKELDILKPFGVWYHRQLPTFPVFRASSVRYFICC